MKRRIKPVRYRNGQLYRMEIDESEVPKEFLEGKGNAELLESMIKKLNAMILEENVRLRKHLTLVKREKQE